MGRCQIVFLGETGGQPERPCDEFCAQTIYDDPNSYILEFREGSIPLGAANPQRPPLYAQGLCVLLIRAESCTCWKPGALLRVTLRMFPLRSTEGVSRFPWGTLALVVVFAAAEILLWFPVGSRQEVLMSQLLTPAAFDFELTKDWVSLAVSFFFFGNLFALWVTCLYVWSFLPALLERDSIIWTAIASVGVALAAFFLYRAYHGPQAVVPLLMAQVWVSALLGLAMRHEIWDTMTTVVVYQKGAKLFEVPSYVLLFFWFFYIMIGNLFLDPQLSDAPTSYFLPLVAFIFAFVIESIWMIRPSFRKVASP